MRFCVWKGSWLGKGRFANLWLLCFFILPYALTANPYDIDTIRLDYHEILITSDTTFYGKRDTVVYLASTVDFNVRKDRDAIATKVLDSISSKTKKVPIAHNLFNAMRIRKNLKVEEDSATALNPAQLYFDAFEGKVIRSLRFRGVDIFEGNVQDTTKIAKTWAGKVFNKTHYNSRSWVLKNYLLFKNGDRIDPLEMSESERILRQMRFIEDSRIYIKQAPESPDSVDVVVVTKDNFPVAADFQLLSTNHFIFDPYNTNFIGLGHKISGRLIYDQTAPQTVGYGAEYKMENLFGNYVTTTLGFSKFDELDMYQARIEKPFISTDIRFGGEVDIHQLAESRRFDRGEEDTVYRGEFPYEANVFDIWSGYSFYYFNNSNNNFLNISARHAAVNYVERNYLQEDSTTVPVDSAFYPFHNAAISLANLSLRKIDYLKTSKLFGYGRTEDVPYGYILDLTTGFQKTEYYERPYFGAYYFWGKYFPRTGYFSYSLGSGTFVRSKKTEDWVTGANFTYFSPLSELFGMEFRNTLNVNFNSVTNPLYYGKINLGDDIRVLRQDSLYGQSKFTIQAQTIIYTYINMVGFRFAFYPFIDVGWLARDDFFRGEKRFFAVYGLGVQIKNESLLFPGLHIKAGYMPHTFNGRPNFAVTFLFRDIKLFKRVRSMKPQVIDEYFFH